MDIAHTVQIYWESENPVGRVPWKEPRLLGEYVQTAEFTPQRGFNNRTLDKVLLCAHHRSTAVQRD